MYVDGYASPPCARQGGFVRAMVTNMTRLSLPG
jgi:hypothetical protein